VSAPKLPKQPVAPIRVGTSKSSKRAAKIESPFGEEEDHTIPLSELPKLLEQVEKDSLDQQTEPTKPITVSIPKQNNE